MANNEWLFGVRVSESDAEENTRKHDEQNGETELSEFVQKICFPRSGADGLMFVREGLAGVRSRYRVIAVGIWQINTHAAITNEST